MNNSMNGMGVTDQMLEAKMIHRVLVAEAIKKIKNQVK
jgi:hypothetical protein